MESGAAFYAKQGETYILKLVGDIRYTMGCALGDFLESIFQNAGCAAIVVDLTETTSIDSTSLGLLAKIARFNLQRCGQKTSLLSTNPDVNQVLDSMGFYEIFDISDSGETITSALNQLEICQPCKEELTRIIYDAHHTLSSLNPRNRQAFQGVMDALRPASDTDPPR